MAQAKIDEVTKDLDIGDEQVTSNECWDVEDLEIEPDRVLSGSKLGEEQVTSNECYDVERIEMAWRTAKSLIHFETN